jgi:hypothetical protein
MNRFESAISKLVKAFHNGTLEKWSCTACGVGTICDGRGDWSLVIERDILDGQIINMERYVERTTCGQDPTAYYPKSVIDATSYSITELARIEEAFESNTKIMGYRYSKYSQSEIMQDQYTGLMAVVDVLCDIEGINAEPTKAKFELETV